MTTTRFTVAAAGLALVLGATACDNSKLTGVNRNPNAPTTVSPQFLFPSGTRSAVSLVQGSSMQLYFTELWAQHMAEYQYPEASQYSIRPTTVDAYWQTFYATPLQDFALILRQETLADDADIAGPAMVMRAWTYQSATDLWGNIPFTQANMGDQGNITPAYDTQESIYRALIADLEAAADAMGDPASDNYGAADIIYRSDMAKWQRFANSLRVRMALRLADRDAAFAEAQITDAFTSGGFTSNADNAVLDWLGDGQNDAPYFTTFKTRDDHRVSVTLVDTLASLGDPRLAIFADTTQYYADSALGPVFRGLGNGLDATTAGALGYYTSRIGDWFKRSDMPSMLMSYAEYLFALAEARERGLLDVGPSAAQLYADGIRASMEYYGIDDAAITAYIAAHPYVPGAAGLAQIGVQKWIALFGQGLEAWSEWRRTGYPNLVPAANAQTPSGEIPLRLVYPQSEQSFNNSNLTAAINAMGGDTMVNPVWWDVD